MLGGYGFQEGMQQHSQNRSKRRAEIAAAFQEMLKTNPQASVADMTKFMEDETGVADYWLRGSLPKGEQLQKIYEENQRKASEAKLETKLKTAKQQLELRAEIDRIINDEILYGKAGDDDKILWRVAETLGAKDDPQMQQLIFGMAGDMGSRRKRLEHEMWTKERPAMLEAFRIMQADGMPVTRESYKMMTGKDASPELWEQFNKERARVEADQNRKNQVELLDIQTKLADDKTVIGQLALSSDSATRERVREQIRVRIGGIVPDDQLARQTDMIMESLERNAMIFKQSLAMQKREEAQTLLSQQMEAEYESARQSVGLLADGRYAKNPVIGNALRAITIRNHMTPEMIDLIETQIIGGTNPPVKVDSKDTEFTVAQKIETALVKMTGEPLVSRVGVDAEAKRRAQEQIPLPMKPEQFEQILSSQVEASTNRFKTKLNERIGQRDSSTTTSEWVDEHRKTVNEVNEYISVLEMAANSVKETRSNAIEHDGYWGDSVGEKIIQSTDARIKAARQLLEELNSAQPPSSLIRQPGPNRDPLSYSGDGGEFIPASYTEQPQYATRGKPKVEPEILNLVETYAPQLGLDPTLVFAVMRAESAFNKKALSPKGASGLMQLMPGTAREVGVQNIWDPQENVLGGMIYLAQQIQTFGSLELALAAYNAGPGAVMKHKGIPPYKETQNYVAKIMSRYNQLRRSSQEQMA